MSSRYSVVSQTRSGTMRSSQSTADDGASIASRRSFASIFNEKGLGDTMLENDDHLNNIAVARAAATYFDKFEKDELQESLAFTSLDWLLSVDDTRIPVDLPSGLIGGMQNVSQLSNIFVLVPVPEQIEDLELREIHQIIRELVLGIYILNETPSLFLESNFDQSTACQIPPAYHDTRIGQLMIAIDYMMKSLWHGVFFPKDKRSKFTERWRQSVNLNLLTGEAETKRSFQLIWTEAGLLDMSKDPDFHIAYSNIPNGDSENQKTLDEQKFFMKHVDDIAMILTFKQESVQCFENMFVSNADYHVVSVIRNDKIDLNTFERLHRKLRIHEQFISKNLENKQETRREMTLLKIASFLMPFFIALRKKHKIPDVSKLLPPLTHDECKTDREFPPIVISPDQKCKFFDPLERYHGLHGGIQMERDTPVHFAIPDLSIVESYESIIQNAISYLTKVVKAPGPMQDSYPLHPVMINGKKYCVLLLELEAYYPVTPKLPKWVHAYYEEISKLKPKKLPLGEAQIHEQFRKRYGYQRTVKLKQVPAGLQAAAQRGLVAVFHSICRRQTLSRLGSQDQLGLSLVHHAAMKNRPQIITQLVVMGLDVNVRRFNNASASGIMPIHLASKCGALDSLACLLAYKADFLAYDSTGFASIHYASFYNNASCIRLLLNKSDALTELPTSSSSKSTPLLLASSSGATEAVICLLDHGADMSKRDNENNSAVHLATLHEHTHILEYFINEDNSQSPVWEVLVQMLSSKNKTHQEKACKCLEELTLGKKSYWKPLLQAKGVEALVLLLQEDNEVLQSLAASVLCNIGDQELVRKTVGSSNAIPTLLKLLQSTVSVIHSRAAVVLGDLACINECQMVIANEGGIEPLVNLLSSNTEHVLVNAVNSIRVLCDMRPENQTEAAACGAVPTLIELLSSNSKRLQANTAACVSALAKNHQTNQGLFISEGAVQPLVQLMRRQDSVCQLKAASALESLAEGNPSAQQEIDNYDAAKSLIRLLKLWAMEMKEQGATALWALAGNTVRHQKRIAELIGINILVDMMMTKSEKLQYVAGMALTALGRENIKNQNRIAEGGGIMPLVRILRAANPAPSEKVLIMAIQVLGSLCVGVAHQSNKATQKEIANTDALSFLVNQLKRNMNPLIQVEVAITLAKVALSNSHTQEQLSQLKDFSITQVLHLMKSKSLEVRLKAATALATFAYNNTNQQCSIRLAGGVRMDCFNDFLEAENEDYQAYAAFQIIILARVISDVDQVTLSARGVELLVKLLKSEREETQVLTASLMASLAHTRAGIPDAMIAAGVVENLVNNLFSSHEEVRGSAAVALGYLSFNRTAARMLLVQCRNKPGLYNALENNLGMGKLSMEFVDEWRRNVKVGLPSQSLEINGGPPVQMKPTPSDQGILYALDTHDAHSMFVFEKLNLSSV